MIRPWEPPSGDCSDIQYSMPIGSRNHLLSADLSLHYQLIMVSLGAPRIWIITCKSAAFKSCTRPAETALPGPGQQHNLPAKSAPIDAGMDVACGCERQPLDHDGLDGARAQQLK